MKTKFRLIICLLMMSMCFAKAQDVSDFFRFTYGSDMPRSGIGSDQKGNQAAAIQIPTEKVGLYARNRITKIRFFISTGVVDDLKVFVTTQLSAPYTYEQAIEGKADYGWNEVTLNTPYEIEEEIFIGYELNGKGGLMGIIYEDSPNLLADWYRDSEGDEWKHISEERGWEAVMAIEAIIEGDNLPKTDVDLTDVVLSRHAVLNEPVTLKGTIQNNGVETIESLDITYDINGKTSTHQITGLSIPYETSGSFKDPAFVVTEEGDFDVKITISKVNGKADLNPENNTVEKHILCKESFEPRNVLIEMFSTENCPNCAEGHNDVDAILKDYDRIVRVDHHAGYGFDKFTIPASREYEVFYGTGQGTYAPALMLDRTNMADFGALDRYKKNCAMPMFSVSSNLKEIVEEGLATPAYASLDLKVDTTELPKLKITVSGKAILPISADSSRVNIYITEDDIFTTSQSNTGGKWYHQHTLRENLTHFRGDSVDLEKGFELEYTTEIQEKWNKNRLNVVAFVANYDSQDINNCVVYNAKEFSLYDKVAESVEEVREDAFPKVYVWGNKLYIEGEYICADVYNSKGEKRMTCADRSQTDISNLEAGVYIVQVLTKEKVKSFKVVI